MVDYENKPGILTSMNNLSEDKLDSVFSALSDRSRRKILLELCHGEKTVMELGSALNVSKQLVSKHLNVLEKAELITKQKDGRIRRCQYNPEAMEQVQSLMNMYREFWNNRFDALEAYIEKIKE